MPLADVFKAIEKQTGNKLIDNREDQGGPNDKRATITIDLKNEPFWAAMDAILDQAKLGVYSYGGEDALSIVARDPNDGPRKGRAVYQGPFRLEATDAQAQRSFRQAKGNLLKVLLEIAWEPRLRPIAISQPAADVVATGDDGSPLTITQPEAMQDVEVPTGTQAAELTLPFDSAGPKSQENRQAPRQTPRAGPGPARDVQIRQPRQCRRQVAASRRC